MNEFIDLGLSTQTPASKGPDIAEVALTYGRSDGHGIDPIIRGRSDLVPSFP